MQVSFNGSAFVRSLFTPAQVENMLNRLRAACSEKWEEDKEQPLACGKPHLLDEYLEGLLPMVEYVVGGPMRPLHSYARIYRPGSVLYPHTDKEALHYGVTVCLARGGEDWPLKVGDEQYVDEVGSGVVYDGSIRHYRRGKAPDEQAQVFFHYARKE